MHEMICGVIKSKNPVSLKSCASDRMRTGFLGTGMECGRNEHHVTKRMLSVCVKKK